jgi:hypothetical protein
MGLPFFVEWTTFRKNWAMPEINSLDGILMPGDLPRDISPVNENFMDKNLDTADLRKRVWER